MASASNSTEQEKKYKIATQTKIAFVGYLLLIVAQIVLALRNHVDIKVWLPTLIGYIIVAFLGLYVINCAVFGNCQLYSYIMGYTIAAIGVIFVSFTITKVLS